MSQQVFSNSIRKYPVDESDLNVHLVSGSGTDTVGVIPNTITGSFSMVVYGPSVTVAFKLSNPSFTTGATGTASFILGTIANLGTPIAAYGTSIAGTVIFGVSTPSNAPYAFVTTSGSNVVLNIKANYGNDITTATAAVIQPFVLTFLVQ